MGSPTVAEFGDFMPDAVTIAPYSSMDGSGVQYGTPVSYQCRIRLKNYLVVGRDGRTVTARGKVFLMSATVIGSMDQLTLPVGYEPRNPPIISVNVNSDESGAHHTTILIG